jgi:hypothetical protein
MSFSYKVKEELCGCILGKEKEHACLYGMLLFCRQFDFGKITFQTECEAAAELFCVLADKVSGKEGIASAVKLERKNSPVFVLSIENKHNRIFFASMYKIKDEGIEHRFSSGNIHHSAMGAFLAGAFIASGSIIDPNKEYHLEFVTPHKDLAEDIQNIIVGIGINAKTTERKNAYVVYIKDSEGIEDLLTFMGATQSALEIMNIKILKDVRNKANRMANCDSANIEKTVKASVKQIEDIELVSKRIGLDSLPEELKEIAKIRLEYPELSLREMGQMLSKPIGRSGVNHRMKRLSAIAESLRGKEAD